MNSSHTIRDDSTSPTIAAEPDSNSLLTEADRCFSAHDFAGAWQHLNHCAQTHGGTFELYCAMAMCSLSLNDLERSRMEYLTAIRYNPDNAEVRLNLAIVEKSLGMVNDAYHQVQIVLSLNSEDILARRLAADINVQRGFFDLALVEYQMVLRQTPNDVQVLLGYGRALYSLGKYQAALDVYEKILTIDSSHDIARDNVLIVRNKLGDHTQAPFSGDRKQVLQDARQAMNAGDHMKAKSILQPLVFASDVTADICFVYGNICCLDQSYEEALVNYSKMVDLDPSDIRGHIRLCLTACMTGLTELARQHLVMAKSIAPDHEDLIEAEVELLMAEKNFLPAAQFIYKEISKDMTRVELIAKLGVCFENLGDLQLAQDTYDKVLEISPNHSFAKSRLIRIQQITNTHEQEDSQESRKSRVA
ncbi:MAG: tetratricopeptide repeat protein [Verrucomicrobia bacterium]|nr:tetratricopeptide repeat protein [Verrucomicrobiota bacterium]